MTGGEEGASDIQTAIREILSRVTRLEDERAILDTLHRYGQAADDGRDEDWAELFTEDGEFLSVDRDRHPLLHERGRDALRAWLRRFRAGETKLSKHCVLAPVVTIDGETATVVSYLTRLIENEDPHQQPVPLLMGRYEDAMAKGADGRWRFRKRIAIVEAPLIRRAT